MPVPFLDSTSFVSSTSLLLLPSPTVLTRREMRRMFLSSTLVVEPSMSPFLPLKRGSLRSRLLPEIPTWEEKISTTVWLTISSKISSVATARICRRTSVPSVVSVLLANVPSVLFLLPPRPTLRLIPSLTVSTSTQPSPVLVSRISVWTTSRSAWTLAKRFSVTPRSPRTMSTRLSLLEDPPVFLRCKTCFPNSSTERSYASPSTPMRLLPLAPPSRLPFFLVLTSPRSFRSFCCWMSLHFPSVLRLLEVS
mmetsp:Transcript_15537/g.25913  ORF Transcript_15537/g.25913 Transcript_15537/m.25913 type:complete len:251 (-) Transcript_15537:785-1537(-)